MANSYLFGALKIITGNHQGQGVALILQFLWLFNVTFSAHNVRGEHLVLGFGIGPLEISILFHRWLDWKINI